MNTTDMSGRTAYALLKPFWIMSNDFCIDGDFFYNTDKGKLKYIFEI